MYRYKVIDLRTFDYLPDKNKEYEKLKGQMFLMNNVNGCNLSNQIDVALVFIDKVIKSSATSFCKKGNYYSLTTLDFSCEMVLLEKIV
ncbi:hypothetical protein [Metaclostridioides mangenotii]|uniref:hypothetical protein n=1 Tax=Metaclostridioides mangenotii TaxID=1540 RepID=UPI00046756E8|nr:hypothetical protein [Clostridioides mangenotii]